MKKTHVVILSTFLSPFRSGAEACVEEVATLLKDQFDFTIVTARMRKDLPERDSLNGIPIVRVGYGQSIDKWLYPFLAPCIVRKLNPDIVHAILESFAGVAMVRCGGYKRVLTCQSTNTSLFLRCMHREATCVTVISRILKERARELGRSDAVLIPNGVAFTQIRRARERSKKVSGQILFVGRLEKVKGVDILLHAFAVLMERDAPSVTSGVHLRIIGDGSERHALENLASALGLTDRVTFLGRIPPPAVYDAFAAAEIFVGLSRSEALGNVFLEAQAAGCATVATAVGGIPDIIEDGRTGLLVPPNDSDAVATTLMRLLRDASLRVQLQEEGKRHAERYDWAEIAEQYADLYMAIQSTPLSSSSPF